LNQDEKYYRSLTRNMVLVITVVSLIPLVLISAITRHYFQVSYREEVVNRLKESVRGQGRGIDHFLNERVDALKVAAQALGFERFAADEFVRAALPTLQREFGQSFIDLGIINEEGTQIAYAGPYGLKDAVYADASWYSEAVQKEHYVSDVIAGKRGRPHIVITARHRNLGKQWLVRASLDFEGLNALAGCAGTGLSASGFILNKKGDFQTTSPSPPLESKESYLTFLASQNYTTGQVSVSEREESSGAEYIDVMTLMNDGRWVLVYRESTGKAFAAMYRARMFAIATFLIGAAAIILAAVILSKRMVRHVAESAQEKQMINDQLVEAGKLASLGEMAAGIAHEINNPVGIMIGEAGWMQDLLEDGSLKQQENEEEFRRSLQKIVTQGRRCKEITHKLLSFARKTDPTLRPMQINDLVTEVVGLSEQRARFDNVRLITAFDDQLPLVRISPSEVQQVLLNLINNSLDAMEKKGGKIEVTTAVDGDYVVVHISDNGPGIPEAYLKRIFEPFFTTKPPGKGTGLGLSICYGIIKKIGGEITVESELGIGTTFQIFIPIRAVDRAPTESASSADSMQ
jgi:two-component system, NtrC family, sensor kinase